MDPVFTQTMAALAGSLKVSLIGTDLLDADIGMSRGMQPEGIPIPEIIKYAQENNFNQILLYENKENGDPPWWISKIAIVDRVNEKVESREVTAADILSDSTMIGDCIRLFAKTQRNFFLILVGDRLLKIVTVSDLNKLPVRVYLNTLLSHLEGLLSSLIENTLPNNKWLNFLSSEAVKKINDLNRQKMEHDFDTKLIHCTTLSNKITIIHKSDEIKKILNFKSGNVVEEFFDSIKKLRNKLAHNEFIQPNVKDLEELRDHLLHEQPLTKRKDVEWLDNAVYQAQQMIKCIDGIL